MTQAPEFPTGYLPDGITEIVVFPSEVEMTQVFAVDVASDLATELSEYRHELDGLNRAGLEAVYDPTFASR